MKRYKLLTKGIVGLMLFGAASQSQVLAETNEFTSSELKQIRFLSRALIKSRANEKIKIDKQMVSERKRIQAMKETLQNLEAEQFKNLSDTNLKALSPVVSVSPIQINGQSSSLNTSNKLSARPVVSVQKQKRESLGNKQAKLIASTVSKLEVQRNKLEEELPSKFLFWKKRNHRDKRNEHVINVTSEIEKELQDMQVTGAMDLAKIKSMKERLTLKAPERAAEEIQPTFQTITKHSK